MTPTGFYQGKKNIPEPTGGTRWIKWVPAGTVAGGILAALAAFHLGRKDLALGLGWGSVLVSVNFFCLKILTEKVLRQGSPEGRKSFWFWNCVRWFFLSAGCWIFLSISPVCLAGAGISYFWFLLILGWTGLSFSGTSAGEKGRI